MNEAAGIGAGGDEVMPLLLLVGFAVLFIIHLWWHFSRSRTLVERWAKDERIRLLSCEYRWLSRGPFFWRTSKGQAVYRITVDLPDGRTRRGWVRVGGWLIGLFSSRVDVRWDEVREGFPVVFPSPMEDDQVARP